MNERLLNKYRRSRAVDGPWCLSGGDRRADYRAVVVIPALAERRSLPRTLDALSANCAISLEHTLIVVVVNNRGDAAQADRENNAATLRWLVQQPYPQLNLAWIDVSSAGLVLPPGEGVGMARKIGFDLALACCDWAQRPLLISLDADTLVDRYYLTSLQRHFSASSCAGAVIPYYHQEADTPEQDQAIRAYELYLRSYLFGLEQANSPYAYHTIGSAFACRASAYIAAGGMNRRSAGEDFYFLQNLAKTCGVDSVSGTVVRPSARFSERVPFGTGRAVQAQVDEGTQLFRVIGQPAFAILRDVLGMIQTENNATGLALIDAVAQRSRDAACFLDECGFVAVWERFLMQHRSTERRLKAFHDWFDALKTRQLLSRLDDGCMLNDSEKVCALLGWGGYPRISDEAEQLALLEKLHDASP